MGCECNEWRMCVWGNLWAAGGEQIQVLVNAGFGGSAEEQDMSLSVGEFVGKFIVFSLTGGIIPAGYFHLTAIEVSSLADSGCEPGSFGLIGGVISDVNVSGAEGD